MKISICLPYMEREYDRATTLDWCRLVDQGPFESLSCGERITSYTQDMPVLLAAAAALTERVRIVPSLYVLPMHSAVKAAKEIATLDVLSGGRVTVTVGVGGREGDYRAVGAPFERRLARLEEGVAAMRRVWACEPPVEGWDPVGPVPMVDGGPTIWAGAMQKKSIARAARWADGVYGFSMDGTPQAVVDHFELARGAWQAADRASPPTLATGFWYSLADRADQRLKRYVFEYLKFAGESVADAVAGSMRCHDRDSVRRALDGIEEAGCQECFLVPATLDLAEVERASELVARR